jgi:hypothetical protein
VKALDRIYSEAKKSGSRHAEGRPCHGAAFCMPSEKKIRRIAGEVTVENVCDAIDRIAKIRQLPRQKAKNGLSI